MNSLRSFIQNLQGVLHLEAFQVLPQPVRLTISGAERSASPHNTLLTRYRGPRLPRRGKLRSTRHALSGMSRTAPLPLLSKPEPLRWVPVWFCGAHKNKIAAQRSGCDFGRRRKGANFVFAAGGNEVQHTLRRRGGVYVSIDFIAPGQGLPV